MDELFSTPPQQRGMQLSQIQTSFNCEACPQPNRSGLVRTVITEESATTSFPTQDSIPLNRQKSKNSLLSFLGRSKSSIKSNQKLETGQEDRKFLGEPSVRRNTQESSRTRAPHLAREVHVSSPHSTTTTSTLQRRTSKGTPQAKANKKVSSVISVASWDPPELFKAYPQAVKHTRLRAPVLHVKAILQLYEQKKATLLDHDVTQNVEHPDRYAGRKRWEKDKVSKQKMSEHDGWVEKVYVLATSGYLLEYAGNGAFDRVPEKLMPLGKESAAFASDAIPGEHWVLQVSRFANDAGSVSTEGSTSMFKKFRFGNDMRRFTSTLLLVFDNPDDMNSWLVVIRKEIEALGGKKYQPDVDVLGATDEIPGQLRERPSRQYLVKRDPNRFAEQTKEFTNATLGPKGPWMKRGIHELSAVSGRRKSMATQGSMESPSLSNAIVSSDQACLEGLKENSGMSYVSTGAKTMSTSRVLSPERSPARATFSPEDLIPKPDEKNSDTGQISSPQKRPTRRILIPVVSQKNITDIKDELESEHADSMQEPTSAQSSSPIQRKFCPPSFSKRYSCVTNPTLVISPKSVPNSGHKVKGSDWSRNRDSKSSVQRNLSEEQVSQPREQSLSLKPAVSKYSSGHNGSTISRISDEVTLLRPNPDLILPRRFSSLEYTGKGPIHISSEAKSSSPHPPPMISLPALPEQHLVIPTPSTRYQYRRFHRGDAEDTRKTQRPVSMQVHNDHVPSNKYNPPQLSLQHRSDKFPASTPGIKTPRAKRAPPPPPLSLVQPLSIQNREGMPHRTGPPIGDSLPEVTTSFLNLEHSPLLQGSWNTFPIEEPYSLQDVRVN